MKKAILVVTLTAAALAAVWWFTEPKSGVGSAPPATSAVSPPPAAPAAAPSGETPAAPIGSATLLWRNATSGENLRWRFGPKAEMVPAGLWEATPDWVALANVPGGWGKDDLVAWRHGASGEVRLWKVSADKAEPSAEILPAADANWRVAAFADVNADGYADAIWLARDGSVAVWLLRDGKVGEQALIGNIGAGWFVAQVGDFDGDGRADLFWRKTGGTIASIWSLDGAKLKSSRDVDDTGRDWSVLTVGKFDAEAGDDLLWQARDGRVQGWSGADPGKQIVVARHASADWAFVAAMDIDGNGRTDLLWRNPTSSQVGAWLFDTAGAITDRELPQMTSDWAAVSTSLVVTPVER